MLIDIFQVERASIDFSATQTRKKVKTQDTNFFDVQDVAHFSEEAVNLANQMNSRNTPHIDPEGKNITDSELKLETNLEKIVKNKFRSYVIRPEYRNTTEEAAEKGDGRDGNGDDGNSGNEGKIKKIREKIEEVYASDLPDPAKETIVKGLKKQIDILMAEMSRKK